MKNMTDHQLLEAMFEEIKNINSQLEENTQITKAFHYRQDETDAKIDTIAIDIHKLHGEVPFLKD